MARCSSPDDGAETDLDLGHYERFTDTAMSTSQQRDHRLGLSGRHQQGTPVVTTREAPFR